MKRLLDILISFFGIIVLFPFFVLVTLIIFFYDFKNPFYLPARMGKNMKPFNMFKFRTMILNADKNGVISTSVNDSRITPVGKVIRLYKLDELLQLINVFNGDMSLVGPRPQVVDYVEKEFNEKEKIIFNVRPGITDFSSIIFSDEGEILKNSKNPDLDYNRLIRPWKSKLGIFYVENRSILIDIKLIFLTVFAIINKKKALYYLTEILKDNGAPSSLIQISKREKKLKPQVPTGLLS